jgi:hypothetical protein
VLLIKEGLKGYSLVLEGYKRRSGRSRAAVGSRVVGSEDPRPVVALLEALPVPAQTWADPGADVVRMAGPEE